MPQQEEKSTGPAVQMGGQTNSMYSCGASASRASQHQKANDRASLSKTKGYNHSTPGKEIQVKLF
jgi:hypothetical protein